MRKLILTILTLSLALSCGDSNSADPIPSETEEIEYDCSAPTVTGEAITGEELERLGVYKVRYDADLTNNKLTLELLDENDSLYATIETESVLTSALSATATLVITDANDETVLAEASDARFVQGLGSRIKTTRVVDGKTLHLWKLATGNPGVATVDIGAPTEGASGTPEAGQLRRMPEGEFHVLSLYDTETEEFLPDEDVSTWAEEAGISGAVDGEWTTLLGAVFDDTTWRGRALANATSCLSGGPVSVAQLQGLDTPEFDDDSATVRQALTCAEEEKIKRETREFSETMDRLDTISGLFADGTVKGFIIKHADKVGIKGTFDVPGFGKVTITPDKVATIAGIAQTAVTGVKVGAALANPLGLLLAGIGATAYIAARVNDAFGEQIRRELLEDAKREAQEEAEEAERDRQERAAEAKKKSSSILDPRIRTFDKKSYDFMAEGDFLLARATSGPPLEVHVRQGPREGAACSDVTYNLGVATRSGEQRISAYADDPYNTIRLDGEIFDVPNKGSIFLDNGTILHAVSRSKTLVAFPSGDSLSIWKKIGVRLNVYVSVTDSRTGAMEGLVGNFNSDSSDDVRIRGGRVLDEPVDWDVLYGEFRDSWLLTAEESLLDYEAGETPDDYFNPDMPQRKLTLDDLDPTEVDRARMVCVDAEVNEAYLDDCTMDVVCTGDDSEAEVHARETEPDSVLDVEAPIFLDGWTVEGPDGNGDWTVSASGREVLQTINGDPTFFVSPNSYIDQTIRGKIEIDSGDDDYVGFVFGYNGPFSTEGDDPNSFDFLILAWKKFEQDVAPGGFTLARVRGPVSAYNPVFWGHAEEMNYEVLASDHGPGKGWTNAVPNDFELAYGRDRVQVSMNGRRVFDISAADAGVAEFPEGRFGFYNYSQPQVTYSDFSAVDGLREVGTSSIDIDDFAEARDRFSLTGVATIDASSLALVSPGDGGAHGDAWYRYKMPVANGFTTEFTFRMEEESEDYARGIAFVIQNDDDPLEAVGRGSSGGAIGYSAIPHSLVVEFDTFVDDVANDPMGPHVAVQTLYENGNTALHGMATLGDALIEPELDDGQLHWARIEYTTTGELNVYIDDASVPVLTVPVDLSMLRLDSGRAHVGFAGQVWTTTLLEIRSWRFLGF